MKILLNLSFFLITVGALTVGVNAQTTTQPDDTDFQSWNDVKITVGINSKIDLVFPFTLRLANNLHNFGEGKAGAGIVLKPTKRLSISPYYQFIRNRNFAGVYRTEHRYILNGVYKFPTKGFGLSHRSQYEYRDRGNRNSWRYRPSVTIDKPLPKEWVKDAKVFVTEEVFYDSTARKFSRNRLSFGINKALSKNLSLDLYYLRQDDSVSHPGTVHAIGTGWKFKF